MQDTHWIASAKSYRNILKELLDCNTTKHGWLPEFYINQVLCYFVDCPRWDSYISHLPTLFDLLPLILHFFISIMLGGLETWPIEMVTLQLDLFPNQTNWIKMVLWVMKDLSSVVTRLCVMRFLTMKATGKKICWWAIWSVGNQTQVIDTYGNTIRRHE